MKHSFLRSNAARTAFFASLLLAIASASGAQTSTPLFGCPDVYVIAYKQGTGCTPSAYSIRTMTLAGVVNAEIAATDTAHELNAFGLNGGDGFLYGMRFHRYSTGPTTCAFDNTKLVRYDALGAFDSLGIIAPPPGGTVTTAIGMVGMPNKYVFFARDSVNALMIGMIYLIDTQTRGNDTLPAEYHYLTNNCAGKSYADFAVNPSNGKLYAYGIYTESAVVKGTVLELDPGLLTITCVGTPETSVFTNANSNFGGIMFGNDGFMYGVDIYTKKFYRIDAGTGAVTYVATIPAGTSQIRADLGSCAYGIAPFVLPVGLVSFNGVPDAEGAALLQWVTDGNPYERFEVDGSEDGRYFTVRSSIQSSPAGSGDDGRLRYEYRDANPARYYRLRLYGRSGSVGYSAVVDLLGGAGLPAGNGLTLSPNPAAGHVALNIADKYRQGSTEIVDATGRVILRTALDGGAKQLMNLQGVPPGVYTLRIRLDEQTTVRRLAIAR